MKRSKTSVYVCGFRGCDEPLERGPLAVRFSVMIPSTTVEDDFSTPLPLRVCSPSCEHRNEARVFDYDRYLDALAGV